MQIIQPSVVEIVEPSALKKIELACRSAYQSQQGIGEGSAERLLRMILQKKPVPHTSVLEHYRVDVQVANERLMQQLKSYNKYLVARASLPEANGYRHFVVQGNLRAFWDLFRNNGVTYTFDVMVAELAATMKPFFPVFFDYLDIPSLVDIIKIKDQMHTAADGTPMKEYANGKAFPGYFGEALNYATFSVDMDTGITHETVRNRTISPTQESTRYCNYGKLGLAVLDPYPFGWHMGVDFLQEMFNLKEDAIDGTFQKKANILIKNIKCQSIWLAAMHSAETFYNLMLDAGASPQEAAKVLPKSVKANIVLTGTIEEWQAFLVLRNDSAAQPQMHYAVAREIKHLLNAKFGDTHFPMTDDDYKPFVDSVKTIEKK